VFYNEAITVYPESDIAATARVKLLKVDALLQKLPPPGATPTPAPDTPKKKKKWLGLF
jgi:outer membrane protein assembly factor BamD